MDTHFDVLVLGTGLTQSITAAALAKAGFKVVHVDENPYYGEDQASLSHEELLQWSRSPSSRFSSSSSSSSSTPLSFSRSYSLSLAPALIPSVGPFITALILSGVSRYTQFKLLDAVYIHRRNVLERVPGNKEDVFKARDVSLVDKRKLMRFLQFAAGDFEAKAELAGQGSRPLTDFMRDKFSLSEDACEAINYALAYCSTSSDLTLPALVRLREYLRSAGRYGSSPFLVGHYGGLGELAQGFCRTCAVRGGTYILGRKILKLQFPSTDSARASIHLEDVPDILTADLVITSPNYLPAPNVSESDSESAFACGIAIVNRPIALLLSPTTPIESLDEAGPSDFELTATKEPRPDTAVAVFPPGSLPKGQAPNVVRVMQMGEDTLSCPQGKYILYMWTQTDTGVDVPEELLRPYLSAVTSGTSNKDTQISPVDFSLFYMHRESHRAPSTAHTRTLVVAPLPSAWPEIANRSAQDAENIFWDAVRELGGGRDGEIEAFWPPPETQDDDDDREEY